MMKFEKFEKKVIINEKGFWCVCVQLAIYGEVGMKSRMNRVASVNHLDKFIK